MVYSVFTKLTENIFRVKRRAVCLFEPLKLSSMAKSIAPEKKPFVMVAYVCPSASDVSPFLHFLEDRGMNLDSPKVLDAPKNETPAPGKRYVYGLKGIQELFNVSHLTAQRYKDGILKDAVYQSGRKIVVDADKAIELFNTWNGR